MVTVYFRTSTGVPAKEDYPEATSIEEGSAGMKLRGKVSEEFGVQTIAYIPWEIVHHAEVKKKA